MLARAPRCALQLIPRPDSHQPLLSTWLVVGLSDISHNKAAALCVPNHLRLLVKHLVFGEGEGLIGRDGTYCVWRVRDRQKQRGSMDGMGV
jgi:hypothetical protein